MPAFATETKSTVPHTPEHIQLLRGAAEYRRCYYCHSLQPGVQLTGPSLAGLWGKKPGQVEGYKFYSPALKKAAPIWNETNLKKWLTDTKAFIPGSSMPFKGLKDQSTLDALIGFLKVALAPGGGDSVLAKDLTDRDTVNGQRPKNLSHAGEDTLVTEIKHCENIYSVTTADGKKKDYWEVNIQLMVDSSETGPASGKPVRMETGSMGDRFAIVFHEPSEFAKFLKECPGQ